MLQREGLLALGRVDSPSGGVSRLSLHLRRREFMAGGAGFVQSHPRYRAGPGWGVRHCSSMMGT